MIRATGRNMDDWLVGKKKTEKREFSADTNFEIGQPCQHFN